MALNHPELCQIINQRFPGRRSDEKEVVDWDLHGEIVGTKDEDWSPYILTRLAVASHVMSPDQYKQLVHDEIIKAFPTMKLMPGALATVQTLKRTFPNAKMAIATSSKRSNFEKKISYHPRLASHFDVVVTGDEVKLGKPHPDIFLEAARRLGVDPTTCVVFEDAPSGVLGGKRAGCFVVAIPDTRMPANSKRFGDAHVVLRSLEDFDVKLHLATVLKSHSSL